MARSATCACAICMHACTVCTPHACSACGHHHCGPVQATTSGAALVGRPVVAYDLLTMSRNDSIGGTTGGSPAGTTTFTLSLPRMSLHCSSVNAATRSEGLQTANTIGGGPVRALLRSSSFRFGLLPLRDIAPPPPSPMLAFDPLLGMPPKLPTESLRRGAAGYPPEVPPPDEGGGPPLPPLPLRCGGTYPDIPGTRENK